MIPLTPQIRHQCHLMLQAVHYGAEIITSFGHGPATTIDGVRASLQQELALSICSAKGLVGGVRCAGSTAWVVYLGEAGARVLAEWDRAEWGDPEPIPVGLLHTTRGPARYGCDNDTED